MPSVRENAPCSAASIGLREKVRPARLAVVKNETKFALHTLNKRKSSISSELGEFCTEMRPLALCWASFFTELLLEGPCRASFFPLTGALLRCEVLAALSTPAVVGAPHEAVLQPVAGVLDPRVVHFPRCTVSHSIVWARGSFVCCWWRRSPLYARIPHSYNKTARRAAGRGWSGRRESNPPLKLGKLPFYR